MPKAEILTSSFSPYFLVNDISVSKHMAKGGNQHQNRRKSSSNEGIKTTRTFFSITKETMIPYLGAPNSRHQ